MAIIKCKMCGGDLTLVAGQSVAKCEFCGSQQTVPNGDDEKKLTLFARANRLRAACDFDKAAGIYEAIVADFPEDAEAYWGLVLCKYGIEYVDDPGTGKKIPTCHRTSFDSVMDDANLEQALENADAYARRIYRDEAKAIEGLREGILSVSSAERPYDIFICYKESDEKGDRTLDSVIAQDIYGALTEQGYRVFFSRISLEDKLGQAYEPYIFAALNSAKVMLVVGTDYEHFNAVWVKNEWSRFLKLVATDRSKYLFPCYKDISPYDLPGEFRHLQGQDMGKIGAMQDLLRGIEKCLPKAVAEKPKPAQAATAPVKTYAAPPAPREEPAEKKKTKKGGKRFLTVLLALLIAGLSLWGLYTKVYVPDSLYRQGETLLSQERYNEAAVFFENLGQYKDAALRALEARSHGEAKGIARLKDLGVTFTEEGYITFGRFEQNGQADGPEPIEWYPLEVSGSRVLLISRYALYYQRSGDNRQWLQEEFWNAAFTPGEQQCVPETVNDTPQISQFVGDTLTVSGYGASTRDRVFLLSAPEVVLYFGNTQARYTEATPYALEAGAYRGDNGNTWWALRSTGANFVGAESGFGQGHGAIRPALWLDLESYTALEETAAEADPAVEEILRDFGFTSSFALEQLNALRDTLEPVSEEELETLMPGDWLEISRWHNVALQIRLGEYHYGYDKKQPGWARSWSAYNGHLAYGDLEIATTGEVSFGDNYAYEVRRLNADILVLYYSELYENFDYAGEAALLLIREDSPYSACLEDRLLPGEEVEPYLKQVVFSVVSGFQDRTAAESFMKYWQNAGGTEELLEACASEKDYTYEFHSPLISYTETYLPELAAWCFDPQRQPGDVTILKTEYGYLVCYLSFTGPG